MFITRIVLDNSSSADVSVTYTVKRDEIGRGGWSVVKEVQIERWENSKDVVGKTAALKSARQPVELKHRELEVHSGLDHPHILRLLGSFHTHETPTPLKFVNSTPTTPMPHLHMLLAPVCTSSLLELALPLPVNQALSYAHQILSAISYLHQPSCMIAHRDVKLANILVNMAESSLHYPHGKIYLCDLGNAKVLPKQHTAKNITVFGERGTRAPEAILWMGEMGYYDHQIDLWSVGVVIAHLLLGRPLIREMGIGEQNLNLQRKEIEDVLGRISKDDVRDMNGLDETIVGDFIDSDSVPALKATLEGLGFPSMTPLDLLEGLLRYSPKRRLSAADAIQSAAFEMMLTPNQ